MVSLDILWMCCWSARPVIPEMPSSRCLISDAHPDYSLRVGTLVVMDAITMLSMLVLVLVQLLSMLALAVVLSGYERRAMALLHHRDAPVAYLLLGLGNPLWMVGSYS